MFQLARRRCRSLASTEVECGGCELSYSQHALIENRTGLLFDIRAVEPSGRAECVVALEIDRLVAARPAGITVGGDKGFDSQGFVGECRMRDLTPHVAQNITSYRGSAVNEPNDATSGLRHQPVIPQTHRGDVGVDEDRRQLPQDAFQEPAGYRDGIDFVGAAYNLLRMSRLLPAAA